MEGCCENCETKLTGTYCQDCGEKVLADSDFYVRGYIGGFISSLTNADQKLYRTMRAFLLRPGQLSFDYFRGLRKPFLSPIQIFLIASVLFFVFAPDFDLFYIPSKWFFANLTPESAGFVNQMVLEKMSELNLSRSEIALKYDVSVKNNAKAFLFLGIPILALASYFSRPKSIPQFGKHLIFATYNLSFFIVWFLCLLLIAFRLPNNWTPDWLMQIISVSGGLIYFAIANRNTWQDSWPRAIFSSLFQFLFFLAFLIAYRSGTSFATLFLL